MNKRYKMGSCASYTSTPGLATAARKTKPKRPKLLITMVVGKVRMNPACEPLR